MKQQMLEEEVAELKKQIYSLRRVQADAIDWFDKHYGLTVMSQLSWQEAPTELTRGLDDDR